MKRSQMPFVCGDLALVFGRKSLLMTGPKLGRVTGNGLLVDSRFKSLAPLLPLLAFSRRLTERVRTGGNIALASPSARSNCSSARDRHSG